MRVSFSWSVIWLSSLSTRALPVTTGTDWAIAKEAVREAVIESAPSAERIRCLRAGKRFISFPVHKMEPLRCRKAELLREQRASKVASVERQAVYHSLCRAGLLSFVMHERLREAAEQV